MGVAHRAVFTEAPSKWTQHFWMLHVVRCVRLHAMLHVVACCCELLRKSETVQTFSFVQTDATSPNIVGPTMLGIDQEAPGVDLFVCVHLECLKIGIQN